MTGGRAVAAAHSVPSEWRDWRIERLASLMGKDWLAGEWDPERQLIVPLPGGQLTRVLRCNVSGCPSDRYGSDVLRLQHRRQFETSRIADLQAWLSSDQPSVHETRDILLLVEQRDGLHDVVALRVGLHSVVQDCLGTVILERSHQFG